MRIQNGIVYSDKPLLKVRAVRPLDGYKLWLKFNNDEIRIFDFTPLLSTPAFAPLRDQSLFNTVYLDFGITVWNDGDIDINPEVLYEKGTPINAS